MKYLFILILILLPVLNYPMDYWLPCPKPYSGHTEFSVGAHFWKDHLYIRNLQLRGMFYFTKGFRLNSIIRGNDQVNQIEYFDNKKSNYYQLKPQFDELNLEHISIFSNENLKIANSIRMGVMRYLRFPWYGQTGRMDQVVGMGDIRNRYDETGYRGILWQPDLYFYNFAGIHGTFLHYPSNAGKLNVLEAYLYGNYEYKWFDLEFRTGRLVVRDHHTDNLPDDAEWGYCLMGGVNFAGYGLSLYWEEVSGKKYTGISVSFASSLFSRTAGKLRLDYNRRCEGLIIQYPVFYKDINLSSSIPSGKEKVGEIVVERTITFWRIGMQRNFYEHIIKRSGITDHCNCEVVVKREPMLLSIESIVSPVHKFRDLDDLKKWDTEGIRPGLLSEIVTYEFYR